jgi:thioredoxin-related protein
LIRMYDDVSDYRLYDDADVMFLKVNVARKELADVAHLYGVQTTPTIIFFSNGQRLLDAQEIPVALTGFVIRPDLQSLIDQYYGQEVQRRIENKEEKRRQIVQEESESWKLYFYPRYSVVRDYDPSERDME